MKQINKLQTLLNDMIDTITRRVWHVECDQCPFTARNLDHERYAIARGKNHIAKIHSTRIMPGVMVRTFPPAKLKVWSTRA